MASSCHSCCAARATRALVIASRQYVTRTAAMAVLTAEGDPLGEAELGAEAAAQGAAPPKIRRAGIAEHRALVHRDVPVQRAIRARAEDAEDAEASGLDADATHDDEAGKRGDQRVR